MSKNKLSIETLAVKSFVTSFDENVSNSLKAGSPVSGQACTGWYCGTLGQGCVPPGGSNNQPK